MAETEVTLGQRRRREAILVSATVPVEEAAAVSS